MTRSPGVGNAFTLIELLIVVAIISILASIAVPNFVEAQTRAKVARIAADMRTILVGLESYMVDHNAYPMRHSVNERLPHLGTKAIQMGRITTPIQYLTSLPKDIFAQRQRAPNDGIDYWDSRQVRQFLAPRYSLPASGWEGVRDWGWLMVSVGPDGVIGGHLIQPLDYPTQGSKEAIGTMYVQYDPTNGSVSWGNLYRFQGDKPPTPILQPKGIRQ